MSTVVAAVRSVATGLLFGAAERLSARARVTSQLLHVAGAALRGCDCYSTECLCRGER